MLSEVKLDGFRQWKIHPMAQEWAGVSWACLGASSVNNVLASPQPLSAKKFKQIWLQKVGFGCPHHLCVSAPLNLYS